ncbi:flap endonuclease GEN homolog 1 [Latimeria chalumnae]|uniref:flap endonuclease GEN homolog 1 n=1 Tax=Latimeria chalumnae TaxID=7897 RepID=UPI0003C18AC2|nr:PREDICTED: flap endonuclease GEN homolog 1 [Latimeria chalumnae]XP_014344812.1 PREDICTED: flap endonuclease GEN homolog 1 [Latimeria chalumnae]XP_014344813.1 PREDICTED: flap endonuclease GEN homolog 1 [Latimeria chalumnae]XP_014344814.1 PREDICTED: flap endonuclease GEN homolog 1 [Latimeria chalumnae]|eukprot:XP_005997584.1 PREDICTED: flap endonuclease GEN homolog 1 [Latimeria chalumnae]
MGVNELWQILEPVREHVHLRSLSGKILAVDLSLWVCEAQAVKGMMGTVAKPHLRNLFFRVSTLTLMGVKLIFVLEGDAPKVKADTMHKRTKMRYEFSRKMGGATLRTGRSYFNYFLKECCEMLECLGIPWVQAAGEAEAMCAYLNANGYADGCITNDGDVFLYGAQTVYKNFTMNTKDPHVDCYKMSAVKAKLGLDRDALVGLAVLLGCDYLPKGVPGVGKEQALKLLEILKGQSLLHRFNKWKEQFQDSMASDVPIKKRAHCAVCQHPGSSKEHERTGCKLCGSERFCEPHHYDYSCPCDWHQSEQERQANSVENNVKKKAKLCKGFPFNEVISEFLVTKDEPIKTIMWKRPSLLSAENFALNKMEWPKHYTCEKLLTLLTYFDMKERRSGRSSPNQLQPIRILKTRIRNGIPCFEIEWQKPEHYISADGQPEDSRNSVITIEEESLIQAAYPDLVVLFHKEKAEAQEKKLKDKKPKIKKDHNVDDVEVLLSQMSLQTTSKICKEAPGNHCDSTRVQENIFKSATVSSSKNECLSKLATWDPVEIASKHSSEPETTVEWASPPLSSRQVLSASSPNVSAVIAEMHLSDIDWEGTSFSTPPSKHTVEELSSTLRREEPEHSLQSILQNCCVASLVTGETSKNKVGAAVNVPSAQDTVPVDMRGESSKTDLLVSDPQNLCLRDRILLKNFSKSDLSDQSGIIHLRSLLPEELRKTDLNTEGENDISKTHKDTSDLLISNIVHCQAKEMSISKSFKRSTPQSYLGQKASHILTKGTVEKVPSGEKNVKSNMLQNKATVIAAAESSIVSGDLRPHCQPANTKISDCKGEKVGNKTTATIQKSVIKRSVCLAACSSSEDSDSENFKSCKQKPQNKHKVVLSSGGKCFSSQYKPCTKEAVVSGTSQRPAKQLEFIVKEDARAAATSSSMTLESASAVTINEKQNCFRNLPQRSESFQSYPNDASPQQSDGEDSVILLDSPLPLSERLKLRLQSC